MELRKTNLSESKYPVISNMSPPLSALLFSINFRMIICVSMSLTYSIDPGPNMASRNWPWSSPAGLLDDILVPVSWGPWDGLPPLGFSHEKRSSLYYRLVTESIYSDWLDQALFPVRGEQQRYGPWNYNDLYLLFNSQTFAPSTSNLFVKWSQETPGKGWASFF